jgi:hypothetical protein
MDGQKFDELIKQFCTTRLTRWGALRGLVAGVATTVAGSALLADDADAKKKGRGARAEDKKKDGGGAKAEDKKKGGGKDENKGRQGARDEGKGGKKGSKRGGKKGGAKKKRGAKKKDQGDQNQGQGANVGSQAASCATSSTCSKTTPTCPDGNPNCTTPGVDAPGTSYKDDSPAQPGVEECAPVTVKRADGTTCTCQICYTIAANGQDIASWSSGTCSVKKVIIKASPEAKVWSYTNCAGGGSRGDTNLTGVVGHAISHIEFCGITCCVPKTCEDLGVCGEDLDDQCNGTIDCDCPVDCPAGTTLGENTVCTGGECVCTADTCPALPFCGTGIDNGCCGTIDCNCPVDCPGETTFGANTVCTGGECVCTADTCESLGVCGTDLDDGCCGTIDCDCPVDCPAGTTLGENTVCTGGDCVCTADTCESLGKTCGVHDDGCCGTVDCGHCFEGCTPGYWKNHPVAWPATGYSTTQDVNTVFAFGACCENLGGLDLIVALGLKGGSGTCGAAQTLLRAGVAALLNAVALDYPLTEAEVKAKVSTALQSCDRATILALAAELDALNNSIDAEGEHNCPCNNQGCPS